MIAELNVLNEWIPEQMQPGTLFLLEHAAVTADAEDPYCAVLACPCCGILGLITRRQMSGALPVICGSTSVPLSSSFGINRWRYANRIRTNPEGSRLPVSEG